MNIIISNSSGEPIYEQIVSQIRGCILRVELKEGDALPSMRVLAAQLRISIITTKRAYEELEKAGLVVTVAGKGCFVGKQNTEAIRENCLRITEQHLQAAVTEAKQGGISVEELQEMISLLYED